MMCSVWRRAKQGRGWYLGETGFGREVCPNGAAERRRLAGAFVLVVEGSGAVAGGPQTVQAGHVAEAEDRLCLESSHGERVRGVGWW